MKYGRVDKMHGPLKRYCKAHGCAWEDTTDLGEGKPDASVSVPRFDAAGMIDVRRSKVARVEIKSGEKARTKKRTAEAQQAFAEGFPVWRIKTLAEADELIKWLRSPS